jgi:hypothetical protein
MLAPYGNMAAAVQRCAAFAFSYNLENHHSDS